MNDDNIPPRFTEIKLGEAGHFKGKATHRSHIRDVKEVTVIEVTATGQTERVVPMKDEGEFVTWNFEAALPLFLIREAWETGCDFEDLADGFGKGKGTMGGDWSGIRDSSFEAYERMFERALNHLFPL